MLGIVVVVYLFILLDYVCVCWTDSLPSGTHFRAFCLGSIQINVLRPAVSG